MHRYQKLSIAALWLINLNTLWFVQPLSQNLSHLGNALHMRWYLVLWAASAALYFFIYTRRWMYNIGYHSVPAKLLLTLCCLGMVISVLLPYAPYEYAELSKWHTRLAMGSTIVYVLIICHILTYLFTMNLTAFQKAVRPYALLVVFELLLYLLNGGVSTLLEIFFPMAMSVYLYACLHKQH
ncbi:hypothetical protein MKC66_07370 [[Clostridium] innocuum]|nr:hypothetical protein [[Clostridium] innocuum]